MIRLAPYLIGGVLVSVLIIFVFNAGKSDDRADELQDEIDTTEEIQDAQDSCPDTLPPIERLLCHNERTGHLQSNES